MDPVTAQETANTWWRLFGRRRARYELHHRFESATQQESLAVDLEQHLRHFAPDGDIHLFGNTELVAAVAVICDDAVYVTGHTVLAGPDDDSETDIHFTTARHACADLQAIDVRVNYPINPYNSGGTHETWTLTFAYATVLIESTGANGDRDLPRALARKVGWPVADRTD